MPIQQFREVLANAVQSAPFYRERLRGAIINVTRDHPYVIDPFGNLMMQSRRNVDPQRMKKDINKLMKISGGWIQTGK